MKTMTQKTYTKKETIGIAIFLLAILSIASLSIWYVIKDLRPDAVQTAVTKNMAIPLTQIANEMDEHHQEKFKIFSRPIVTEILNIDEVTDKMMLLERSIYAYSVGYLTLITQRFPESDSRPAIIQAHANLHKYWTPSGPKPYLEISQQDNELLMDMLDEFKKLDVELYKPKDFSL